MKSRLSGGCAMSHHHHDHDHDADGHAAHLAIDPVCGMSVDTAAGKPFAEHDGATFHFCSAGCRTKFTADPERYLTPREPDPPAPPGTIYTCPMHPEIRQVGPGACPICGMALEPEVFWAEAGPNPEIADFSRRFWVGLVLTAPLLALEMGGHLGLALPVPHGWGPWLQFLLGTPVVLW